MGPWDLRWPRDCRVAVHYMWGLELIAVCVTFLQTCWRHGPLHHWAEDVWLCTMIRLGCVSFPLLWMSSLLYAFGLFTQTHHHECFTPGINGDALVYILTISCTLSLTVVGVLAY